MSGSLGSLSPDSSIPLQAGRGVQQPNPLQQIGEFANTQNAINQSKMFPGALALQQGQQQLQGQAIQGGKVDLQTKINQAGYGSLVPLLAKPPGTITHDDVTNMLASAEKNLGIPTNGVLGHLIQNPKPDGPDFDGLVRSIVAAGAQPYQSAVGAIAPGQGMADTGPVLQPFTRGAPGMANQGVVTPVGAPIQKSTGPETQAAETPVMVQQPDGTWQQQLQPRSARQGANGAPAPAIPGNGAYVPRGTHAPAPQPGFTSPPMGTSEDVAAYKKDQQSVPGIQTGLTNLQTAKEALALTNTGRSSEAVHNFYSFLKTQGISPPFIDGDVTNYDIARKALLSFASSQGASAGTDLGLDTALHSNASTDIDSGAAMHVINQNIGLQRMKLAQVMEAPSGGNGYGSHVTNFANQNDPRAFAWDAYTPAERQQIIVGASHTKGGLDKLDHSLEIAAKHGLIRMPSAQPAAAPPAAVASVAPPVQPAGVPGQ